MLQKSGWKRRFFTIVIFDKNYKFLDVAYQQLTSSGSMNASYTVKEAGYAFLYVSNEHPTQVDVYFDDISMTYTPGAILQSNEYYPFGMQTANSWTRDNTTNKFLYDAGSELNSTTGLYDLPFRNYDATLGRFFQVDALATTSHNVTPYHYAGNNPVAANDPSGLVKQYWDYSSWGAAPWDIKLNTMAGANADAVDRYSRVEAMSWSFDGGGGGGGHFSVIISGEGNVTLTGAAAQNALRALIAGGGVVIDANDKGATAAYFVNTGDININGFWTPGDGFVSQATIVATNRYAENKANSRLIASNSNRWIDPQNEPGEMWYYVWQNGHALAYRPATNILYEINHPMNQDGKVVDGKLAWLASFLGGNLPKSQGYLWDMDDPQQRQSFWSFYKRPSEIRLSPVYISDPYAAVSYFESFTGRGYPYWVMYQSVIFEKMKL